MELPIRLPLEMEIGLGESEETELGGAAEAEGKQSEAANEQGHDERTRPARPKATPAQPMAEAAAPVEEVSAADDVNALLDAGVGDDTAQSDERADAGDALLAGSGTSETGPTGPRRGMGGGTGSGFGAKGALLALRIDVPSVHKSALILETEALLSLLPGWDRLFAGSGLAPLQHFSRFVIASPNLHPSRLGMAARLRGTGRGGQVLRDRVAPLRQVEDVSVGTWSRRGTTTREVAFLDERSFAIARSQDLMRLLALARVIGGQITDAPPTSELALTGLLHMGATEAMSLSVHHVSAFVPNPTDSVPTTLHFSLKDPTQYTVQLVVTGRYETPEQRERALVSWRNTYDEFAKRPEVTTAGLVGAIEHASFKRDDRDVIASTELTMAQLRYLLGALRDLLGSLVPDRAE